MRISILSNVLKITWDNVDVFDGTELPHLYDKIVPCYFLNVTKLSDIKKNLRQKTMIKVQQFKVGSINSTYEDNEK